MEPDRPAPREFDFESPTYTGKFYRGWDSKIYYCESQDPSGLWMAEVDATSFEPFEGRRVTNVSERAVGRTYHRVWKVPAAIQEKFDRRGEP